MNNHAMILIYCASKNRISEGTKIEMEILRHLIRVLKKYYSKD